MNNQFFCMMYPKECFSIALATIVITGMYLLFQFIAKKINDKWPQYNVQLIMMVEAVVLVVLSVIAVGLMSYLQNKSVNRPRFNNNGLLVNNNNNGNRPMNLGTNFNAL